MFGSPHDPFLSSGQLSAEQLREIAEQAAAAGAMTVGSGACVSGPYGSVFVPDQGPDPPLRAFWARVVGRQPSSEGDGDPHPLYRYSWIQVEGGEDFGVADSDPPVRGYYDDLDTEEPLGLGPAREMNDRVFVPVGTPPDGETDSSGGTVVWLRENEEGYWEFDYDPKVVHVRVTGPTTGGGVMVPAFGTGAGENLAYFEGVVTRPIAGGQFGGWEDVEDCYVMVAGTHVDSEWVQYDGRYAALPSDRVIDGLPVFVLQATGVAIEQIIGAQANGPFNAGRIIFHATAPPNISGFVNLYCEVASSGVAIVKGQLIYPLILPVGAGGVSLTNGVAGSLLAVGASGELAQYDSISGGTF